VSEPGKPKSLLYKERVLPSFGTFAAIFALFPSIAIVSEPFDIRIGLAIGVGAVLAIWALLIFRAPKIELSELELKVGRVSILRNLIGEAEVISKEGIFLERGPNLNPGAHKVFQGSVKTAIKIPITDAEDPTPYWLISTRNPDKLAELLKKS
jgi:hypothetical protein